MPKVSQEHADSRRAQILEAAFHCFSRKGFHGTTMREICQQASLSAGAVYSYFASKDEIIAALAEAGRGNVRGWAALSAELDPTPEALAEVWMKTFSFAQSGERESVRLDLRVSAEALDNPTIRELVAGGLATVADSFAGLVSRSQAAGRLDPDLDPKAVAHVLTALYNGLSVHALLDPTVDLAAAQEVVRALLLGRFRTDPETSEQET